jgi:hypothetical protein
MYMYVLIMETMIYFGQYIIQYGLFIMSIMYVMYISSRCVCVWRHVIFRPRQAGNLKVTVALGRLCIDMYVLCVFDIRYIMST